MQLIIIKCYIITLSTILSCYDLTIAYKRHPAVHHLNWEVQAGEAWAIYGPNGAGKSTLLKTVAGLMKPSSGHLHLNEKIIALLSQQRELDVRFPITVWQTILQGAWRRKKLWGKICDKEKAHGLAALSAVELSGFENRTLDTLSAGQLQRVLFARAIMQDAPVILLDEPFNAVDQRSTYHLLQVIGQWQREGRTVIAVLHDIEQIRCHFSHTLLLARESVAQGLTEAVLTPHHLQQARAMAEAWDDQAPACAA